MSSISDRCMSGCRNKAFLIQSPGLIPLLLDALFLDPDHVRKDADEDQMKRPLQADAAESYLQISLFESGRELLSQDHAAMEALHALANGQAFSEEAAVSARGALMVIEGRHPEPPTPGDDNGARHVMVSYQWCANLYTYL